MATAIGSPAAACLRFGLFELDPVAEELRKAGMRIRIQGQPFRILLFLAQHPGEIVTREQLHRTFWKPDTTVDLDRSLAAAIHKIRDCLDDSVTSPRFIETVSRSGYRFIAPVAAIFPEPSAPLPTPHIEILSTTDSRELDSRASFSGVRAERKLALSRGAVSFPVLLAIGSAAVALILLILLLARPAATGSPVIRPLTHEAAASQPDSLSPGFPGPVTDNARIYFSRQESGHGELSVVMLNGGDTTSIRLPEELGSPVSDDVSPDGLRLLLRNSLSKAPENAVWIASPAGQTARQVPGIQAHDTAWMPDGETILYANGHSLYTVHDNGADGALLATLPGRPFRMRWSPDGQLLRLTLRDDRTLDTTLWELRPDGSEAHQILADWHVGEPVCCGTFLSGSGLYVFRSGGEAAGSLWAVPPRRGGIGSQPAPFRLADGPLNYTSPVAARSGHSVIVTGLNPSFRLYRWSGPERRLLPAPAFLNDAAKIAFSRDHQWIAWVRQQDGSVWRSRTDGADRVRVLGAPYDVSGMAWSPDGNRLALMARRPGSPWRILLADIHAGHIEELLPSDPHNQADPQWAGDGSAVVFSRLPQRLAEPTLSPALFHVDLATRNVAQVPHSDGLLSPRISPDGRTLVALNADQTVLRQFDIATGTWKTIAEGHLDPPVFLSSGQALVFRDVTASGIALRQLNLATGQISPFADGLAAESGIDQATFVGLLDDNAPAISAPRDSADLYEIVLPEAN